jgi:hypothetical protein
VAGGDHRDGAQGWALVVAAVAALLVCGVAAAAVWAATDAESEPSTSSGLIRGTKKSDRLTGTDRADRIFGLAGDDWLRGLGGKDLLDGGRGSDTISGGAGNDRVLARDGARDKVFCGFGKDVVVADALDRAYADCETVLRPSKPPPPPETRTDCATSNYSSWSWEECKPGTKIVVTNQSWDCDKPLSEYGPLPIKVVVISTEPWSSGAAATVNNGCTGSPGADVNLILDIRGEGPRSSNGPGADAFKSRVGPEGLRITGSVQCGRRASSAHQDAIQLQGGTDITFVNVEAGGDYADGTSTCQGAGGNPFYSLNRNTNVSVLGGAFISCNRALNGNNGNGNAVSNARFRSGRTDGSDPSCDEFAASDPCVNTGSLVLRDVVCQRWIGGRWAAVPPK